MFMHKRIAMLAAAASLMAYASTTFAADYEPPVVELADEEYVPAEVGSGWYLRGDIGYNFANDYKDSKLFADESVFNDELITGLGGWGVLDLFRLDDEETPISGSVGFGFHFNDYLRADLNVGILGTTKNAASGHLNAGYFATGDIDWSDPAYSQTANGTPDYGCLGSRQGTDGAGGTINDARWARDCAVSGTAKQNWYDAMANVYVDLGTYAGFTPYVGVGAGLLYVRNKLTASANCESETVANSGGGTSTFLCDSGSNTFVDIDEASYNLMYALNAGFAYKITEDTSVDVGYSYRSAPNVDYYDISADGVEKREGFDTHQVKVGLRYDIW